MGRNRKIEVIPKYAKISTANLSAGSKQLTRYSERDSYVNSQSGFGGSNDPLQLAVFQRHSTLTQRSLDALHRFYWPARRVVEIIPEDATRELFEFETEDPEHVKAFWSKWNEIKAKEKLKEALKLARLHGGALMIPEMTDGRRSISRPLNENKVKLHGLKVISRYRVGIAAWESVYMDEPLLYRSAETQKLIHKSRVIRFDGEYLERNEKLANGGWHDSIFVGIEEALKMYGVSLQAASALLQDFISKVLQTDSLGDILASEEGFARMVNRLEFAAVSQSSLSYTLIGKDEDIKKIQTPVKGFSDLVNLMIDTYCNSAGIPRSRLLGQQLGSLAGAEESTRAYYDTLKTYQENKVEPPVVRMIDLVLFSIGLSHIEWNMKWKQLWQISATKQADVDKRDAETAQIHIENGMFSRAEMRRVIIDKGTFVTRKVVKVDDLPPEPIKPSSQPNVTALPNERPSKTKDGVIVHTHGLPNGASTGEDFPLGEDRAGNHAHKLPSGHSTSGELETEDGHVHFAPGIGETELPLFYESLEAVA